MKILLIRFSSIGDIVLTSGIINDLKKKIPDLEIDILTFKQNADLWKNVNTIYTIDKGISLIKYISFLKKMSSSYDFIFDLHDNLRSVIARKIIKGKSVKYHKQSFMRRMFVKYRWFKNALQNHVITKYAQPIYNALDLELPDLETLRPYYSNTKQTVSGKIIIHPFASKYTKTWPDFMKLAELLVTCGYSVHIVGQGNIITPPTIKRILTTSLNNLIAEMSDAECVITTDSGPLHIATALNRNIVAIFGSTTKEFGFYPSFIGCTVIENDLQCRPCHIHGLPACPVKHFKCMQFNPETVIASINRLMKRT